MLTQLSLDDFLRLSKTANRVAIFKEIMADRLTPISIAENLSAEMKDGTILESGQQHEDLGRYSIIAFGSVANLSVKNKTITENFGATTTTYSNMDPFAILRQLTTKLTCTSTQPILNLLSNAIGFVSYDAVRFFETIPDRHMPNNTLPDIFFNFYQNILIYDHLQQKLIITKVVEITDHPEQTYHDTCQYLNELIKKITAHVKPSESLSYKQQTSTITTDISDQEFMQLVENAKKYIIAGDAFQIVLSRCFKKNYSATALDIYRALRKVSPAPYMFYLPIENNIIIGASPETLIKVQNQKVTINPIAGTLRRMATTSPENIARSLQTNEKECAEHMMLVDLARNDLGSICVPNSINVDELLQVKHFSHVSHLTSVVTGQLRSDLDCFDALAAIFPAGTVSGAPKVRAMQIIDELETSRRGIYGGAICKLDHFNNLDSCLAIRTALLTDGIATIRTGAGIVYDSDPRAEANETIHKAQPLIDALDFAERELI